MGSAIHFPNLPFELILPAPFNNAKDIALKTIPSASKAEIRRNLQSVYGFEIEKVRTLNMKGKAKYRGRVFAKPNYKKANVTLKNPLSISSAVYSTCPIKDEKRNTKRRSVSFTEEERSELQQRSKTIMFGFLAKLHCSYDRATFS
ncbi:hypothetical protein UlMin_002662 [Ulmus minor]